MNPPAIHNAAFWGNVDNLRAELAEGVSPDLAYSDEHWSNFDDTGPPRAFTILKWVHAAGHRARLSRRIYV